MLFNLFIIMVMNDGLVVNYSYPEKMTRFECDKQAHIEKQKWIDGGTEGFTNIEITCMTNEAFVKKHM